MTTTSSPAPNSTASTNLLLATLRNVLLSFSMPGSTTTARDMIGESLYQDKVPDSKTYPYGVMNLSTENNGRGHGLRVEAQLEVMLHSRTSASKETVNDVADLFDQAMTFYVSNTVGLTFATGKSRTTVPVSGEPINAETVTVRLVYALVLWPDYLTRLIIT